MADNKLTNAGKAKSGKSRPTSTPVEARSKGGTGDPDSLTPPAKPAHTPGKSAAPRARAAKAAEISPSPETGVKAQMTETAPPVVKPPASTKATSTTATGSAPASSQPRTAHKASNTRTQVAPTLPKTTRRVSERPDQQTIDRMIAEAAYYLAEKRNFAPGWEEEDWETARKDVMDRFEEPRT